MRITTQAWETYIRRLAQLNEKAAQLMAEYLAAHGIADTEALTDYAAALVQKYGEGSAELACQMYDAMAALQNARVSPAEPAAPASRREVARMVQATRESPPQMQRGVSRLVKRAGADTTLKNAQRDGAEFAWVPHGDSCAFCLTLASRGWQRASQAAIKGGHAEHMISMIIPMIWVIEIKFCAAPYCVQQEIYGVERTWELALLILGVLNI